MVSSVFLKSAFNEHLIPAAPMIQPIARESFVMPDGAQVNHRTHADLSLAATTNQILNQVQQPPGIPMIQNMISQSNHQCLSNLKASMPQNKKGEIVGEISISIGFS
jgi:hypothetical protein